MRGLVNEQVPFVPVWVGLREAGEEHPYGWLMTETLTWSGTFRHAPRSLEVPASSTQPFLTDLASVPRILTWLIPRYGKYTKAAVVHDYLCQHFSHAPASDDAEHPLLPLVDRSDADEMFRLLMHDLGVPPLRRALMWSAVSWATIITSLIPGRRSKPVAKRLGRAITIVAVVALLVALALRHDGTALAVALLGVPAAVIVGGTVALGRRDRVVPYAGAYVLTVLASPLLAIGLALALVLYVYFFVEDAFSGFPALRRLLRDLFSREAKVEKLGTAQFARLAAVAES
jgi:hypothetical protein